MTPRVHKMHSTGEAYDRCQYDESIKTGDVLVIESEQVVAIAWAWPYALTKEYGKLHTLINGVDMAEPDHAEGVKLAHELIERDYPEWKLNGPREAGQTDKS